MAVYFGFKPGCYVVGDLLADLEEALPGERVDLTALDVCENLRLLHEAVWGVPVVGSPDLVAWLRVTAASRLFDYKLSLKKASAETL